VNLRAFKPFDGSIVIGIDRAPFMLLDAHPRPCTGALGVVKTKRLRLFDISVADCRDEAATQNPNRAERVRNASASCENQGVCTLFPGRESLARTDTPVETTALTQAKGETLVVEAGTQT